MNFHSKNIIDFENRLPFFGRIFLEFLNFQLGGVVPSDYKSEIFTIFCTGMPHSTLFSVPEKHSLDRNSLDRGLCYLLLCKIEKIA